MNSQSAMVIIMWLAFSLWIGGSLTAQIWLFIAKVSEDLKTRVMLVRLVYWSIQYMFLPAEIIGFGCGVVQVWRAGIPFTLPSVAIPLLLLFASILFVIFFTLPAYAHIIKMIAVREVSDPQVQKQMDFLFLTEKAELLLLILAIIVAATLYKPPKPTPKASRNLPVREICCYDTTLFQPVILLGRRG